jgi:hypothetical protein
MSMTFYERSVRSETFSIFLFFSSAEDGYARNNAWTAEHWPTMLCTTPVQPAMSQTHKPALAVS